MRRQICGANICIRREILTLIGSGAIFVMPVRTLAMNIVIVARVDDSVENYGPRTKLTVMLFW